MRRKLISKILVCTMLATLVTGCGNNTTGNVSSGDSSSPSKTTDVAKEDDGDKDSSGGNTLAGSSGDYSNLPDIVLFQDHWIRKYVTDYPDAFIDVDDAEVNWDDFGSEKLSFSTIDGKHYGFQLIMVRQYLLTEQIFLKSAVIQSMT